MVVLLRSDGLYSLVEKSTVTVMQIPQLYCTVVSFQPVVTTAEPSRTVARRQKPFLFFPTAMLGHLFLTVAVLALFHCKDKRQISCRTRHLTTISHSGLLNL